MATTYKPQFDIFDAVQKLHGLREQGGQPQPSNSLQDRLSELVALRQRAAQQRASLPMTTMPYGGGANTFQTMPNVGGQNWQSTLTPAERWILMKESTMNPTADNPTSTAYGIWQGLEGTRKQYLGSNWQTTDPLLQLDAFRRYYKDRYGTADNAMRFHQSHGWY